jgi:hypothetical protein
MGTLQAVPSPAISQPAFGAGTSNRRSFLEQFDFYLMPIVVTVFPRTPSSAILARPERFGKEKVWLCGSISPV